MDSREIVQRTIEVAGPSRLATTFPAPYTDDMVHVSFELPGFARDWREVRPGWQEYVDEWGNTWARVDRTSKGEVSRGVLETWAALDALVLPDLANPAHYEGVRRRCSDPEETRFRVGGLPGFPFNIARKMRRLDQFLMDVLLAPDQVAELLRRVEGLLARVIEQYARAGVDAVMFPEDWGTQESLMIRPQTWRVLFKPGFERLCGVAHEAGIKVIMHSCGKTTAIIPDLIEVGVDVLQFDQPRLHGIDTLAQFHGRMTFWCPVDIQKTLQTADEEQIRAEAECLVAALGGPEGGFIAGYYGDNASIGLDPHWQDVACRAFLAGGDYARGAWSGGRVAAAGVTGRLYGC